ncbi:TIGR02270 family protein [Myxococcus sp. Y35]|uniref:TIGR02270 family protein n=1 Tax=Pseudomyxococcus flavus TaxID=3115648 RepID=UPI003CE68D1D
MILWDVIEEHLDEAAFLWLQWERALVSPRYVLNEVMNGPEERLLAHLQGLHECGAPAVERLLLPALEEEPGRICAAALTLLADGAREQVDMLLGRLDADGTVYQACIQRVLELAGSEALTSCLRALLEEGKAPALALAYVMGALSVRTRDIPGLALGSFLSSEEPLLRASALRAAGRWGRSLPAALLRSALDAPSSDVREAALEVGLLQGERAAWDVCWHFVSSRLPGCRLALRLLAMGGAQQDVERLARLLEIPELREDVLRALAASGRPEAVEACLPLLREKKVAHLAGEVFSATTGVVLEGALVREPSEEGEEEEAPILPPVSEECAILWAERELPQPEPDAVEAAWKDVRKRLASGKRYLGGQPLAAEHFLSTLKLAPMRRRGDLALEVAIRSKGQWRVDTRGFTLLQCKQLEGMSPTSLSHLMRHFGELATR